MSKRNKDIEPDEFGDIVNRMIHAYIRRLRANKDINDMIAAQRIAKAFRQQLKLFAFELYRSGECTGVTAAKVLGMTQQGFSLMVKRHEAKEQNTNPNQTRIE